MARLGGSFKLVPINGRRISLLMVKFLHESDHTHRHTHSCSDTTCHVHVKLGTVDQTQLLGVCFGKKRALKMSFNALMAYILCLTVSLLLSMNEKLF